jgi:hypothetical protein
MRYALEALRRHLTGLGIGADAPPCAEGVKR